MKERLFIILSLVFIVAALVLLNAASYAPTVREPDREERPNRSTYNGGATGTRAFFEFLRETGKPVTRWQQKPFALLDKTQTQQPRTFIVLGDTRREFEEKEIKDLLTWVEAGNKLVIINREPDKRLLPKSGNWQVEISRNYGKFPAGDSSNVSEMTKDVVAAHPILPDILTLGVNSVMPSKFAAPISFRRFTPAQNGSGSGKVTTVIGNSQKNSATDDEDAPPAPTPLPKNNTENSFPMFAPVVHLTSKDKNILVDYGYGAGRIAVLSDPYIVSNGGIGLVDNLRLATNLVGGDGLIAFDEYHQGFGASGNALLDFFEGTPLPALVAQLALLAVLAIYTQGRRFARPLPLPNPDRRSKLEYVSAMAELQRRTRAFDLAIENIYGRVRRELARFAAVDNLATPAPVLAEKVAERSRLNRQELENLFRDCEDAIHGEPVSDKQAIALVRKLREIERELGFTKRSKK